MIKYVMYDGKVYIVDGYHRYFATRKLGIEKVPIKQVHLPYLGYKMPAAFFDEVIRMPSYWRYL